MRILMILLALIAINCSNGMYDTVDDLKKSAPPVEDMQEAPVEEPEEVVLDVPMFEPDEEPDEEPMEEPTPEPEPEPEPTPEPEPVVEIERQYHGNGNLASEAETVNGVRHGAYTRYRHDGVTVFERYTYVDGLIQGDAFRYFPGDGDRIQLVLPYVDSMLHGTSSQYTYLVQWELFSIFEVDYENGNVITTRTLYCGIHLDETDGCP